MPIGGDGMNANGLEQQDMSYDIDIVMCIDATGSMANTSLALGSAFDQVRKNAMDFSTTLAEKMESENKNTGTMRVKVIGFRDMTDTRVQPFEKTDFMTLPEDNAAYESFLNMLQGAGGGDEPENALEAINMAMQSEWTDKGWKQRHIIMVFTDASAKKLEDANRGAPNYPHDMPKDLADFQNRWNDLLSSSSQNGFTPVRMVVFAPTNLYPWNLMSSWAAVDMHDLSTVGTDQGIEVIYAMLIKSMASLQVGQ